MQKKSVMWFRNDLRLSDNPALIKAVESGLVMPIYIFDEKIDENKNLGAASKWWLHRSLKSLNLQLKNRLNFYRGEPFEVLKKLHQKHDFNGLFWNRRYEMLGIKKDAEIKKFFKEKNIQIESFNGALLWEPHEILKSDKTPYKVFTPYYRKGCLIHSQPRKPLPRPAEFATFFDQENSLKIDDLQLLPRISWDLEMQKKWQIGENFAQQKLENFVKNSLENYNLGRDFPAAQKTSELSPHMHFGEISPHQIWEFAIVNFSQNHSQIPLDKNLDRFLSELGWREFSYYLLYHFPHLPRKNFQPRFDNFAWVNNPQYLATWQKGQTGYPIVDAGMRELWRTGYMHNRVRMIVGSFLVKNLLIDWREGEKWFWDCLVDADLASNSASWQWVAGSGADAAPYFRIFNPILQGEKFDGLGEYTRTYVPELKNLPDKFLFKPWEAPADALAKAGIVLGENYPQPIVSIEQSRNLAMQAFKSLPKMQNEDKLK